MRRPLIVVSFILLISIPLALILHEFTREVLLSSSYASHGLHASIWTACHNPSFGRCSLR